MPRLLSIIGASICLLAAAAVQAQAYPNKLIRIVVPFTPGGGPDVTARTLAAKLHERLGQNVIVENKPGAGGIIGSDHVAKSAPDGHTLLITTTALASYHLVTKSVPFNVHKDFAPIGTNTALPLVVAVANKVPITSVKELIDYAKANPGKLSYASSGVGTLMHLAMESFKDVTGTQLQHIPYKGAAGMINDILAGEVHVMFAALNSSLPHIQAGRMRAIALGEKARNSILDVPTINETVPGFDAQFWFGLAAPAGTPEAIVQKLSAEQRAILALPDVRSRLVAAGFGISPSTPEEMRARLVAESARWENVVRTARIVPE